VTYYNHDFIYCSSLLPVQSLDAALSDPESGTRHMRDPADSPEDNLIKFRDRDRLHGWLAGLPPRLAETARLLMAGETQASIARRLRLTEAAISKRIAKIRVRGNAELADLRNSPLLH
jgi:DNA-binding NarL/FixJ family response regulator